MSRKKADLIIALAEAFGRPLTEPAVVLYVAALAEITDEEAKQAAGYSLRKCDYFPTAAQLIEIARTDGLGYEARALLAFEELDRALNVNRPSEMSPLVRAIANQIGGFAALRELSLEQFYTWKRKEFLLAFVALSREQPDRLAYLAGARSEIGVALSLRRLPGREEQARIETSNRQKLTQLDRQKGP
jgi:hypothetical protein